jgi:hypothetical protein
MSQWIERINTHPIWEELKSLGNAIDLALARDQTDASVIDGLERMRTVLAFCGKRIASIDPALIEPRTLNEINGHLSIARTEIATYVTDGAASHIISANTKADDVLLGLPTILTPVSTEDLTIINASISQYRTTLEKYLQSALTAHIKLREKNDSNEESISALAAIITTQQQRLSTLILDYQTQFSTAQDKRASEFSTAQTEQQTKFSTSAADHQTLFSKEQDARKSEYVTSQLANQEKFASLITEYTQKLLVQDNDYAEKLKLAAETHESNLELLKSNYESSAQSILNQINVRKVEVETLVGVIGNLGVTSGYQKVANLARGMLFLWQGLTVAALGGLILWNT